MRKIFFAYLSKFLPKYKYRIVIRALKNIFRFFLPPDNWKFPVAVISAIITGLGIFIIDISNAPSYISDDPRTCINCHVMFPQYASWQHSSHFRVASCNDCHVPHDNYFRKYLFKASDGLRHSLWFTMRWEPQVIHIKEAGRNVVQENCIRCHSDRVDMVSLVEVTGDNNLKGQGHVCWECHRETPHGTVGSLSSAPNALVPVLESPVPDWILEHSKTDHENALILKK
jgi:cytochrome c nitrite reductase small subunit